MSSCERRGRVVIVYTNHRGEVAERLIEPILLWHGATEWHPEPQWLLEATDLDKKAARSFAMAGISSWRPAPQEGGQNATAAD